MFPQVRPVAHLRLSTDMVTSAREACTCTSTGLGPSRTQSMRLAAETVNAGR
jgi:hypothetical protein